MSLMQPSANRALPAPDKGERAALVALMTVLFSLPACAGSALLHYLFFLCFFVFFALYVFLHTRRKCRSPFKVLKERHPLIFWLLLAFGLSSLVSCLRILVGDFDGFRQLMAVTRYVFYVVVACYALALARLYRLVSFSMTAIFQAYMAGTVFLIFLFLAAYHWGGASNLDDWGLNPPFGRHIRLMGMGAAVAVVATVAALLFRQNSAVHKVLLLTGMLVCHAFLIWTGSRTSLALTLMITLVLVALALFYRKAGRVGALAVILCTGLSFPLAQPFSVLPWMGLQRSIQVSTVEVSSVVAAEDSARSYSLYRVADRMASGRLVIWEAAFAAFRQQPWFGHGPNASLFVVKGPDVVDQPHNFIMQFLVEWGGIGTALLLALLASLAWQGLKRVPAALQEGDADYIVNASVLVLLVVNGLTDGPFYHVQTVLCMATAFAVFPFGRPAKARC